MDINRHNYEAYLLDLLEGSLSVEEQQHLRDFLLLNPDCGDELLEIEPWILQAEAISFQNSKQLKKELPGPASTLKDQNFDLFSIARMEGDLNDDQKVAHQAMVEADDRKAMLWEEWQATQMQPRRIVFKGKDQLKHKNRQKSRVLWVSVISAAAAISLILLLFRPANQFPQQELTEQTEEQATPVGQYDVHNEEPLAVQNEGHLEEQADEPVKVPVEEGSKEPMEDTGPSVNNSAMFAISKDPNRPVKPEVMVETGPVDDLQPRSLRISENHLSTITPIGAAASDKIEPLHVPPVPIHLSSLSVAQISELDLQLMLEDYAEEKDISLWKIADAGIKGINKLAGSDISLLASRDEEGEVSGFRLKSKRFSFSRPLGQEE